jgi:hypothetical protein
MKPQLFKYDGSTWTRMAQSGGITNMGNANNKYITMIVRNGGTDSTGGTLYVGFDNDTDGLEIWRTTNSDPSIVGDWTGPVGSSGLGYSQTNIYDAISLSFEGTDYLYIAVGDNSDPLKIFRSNQ